MTAKVDVSASGGMQGSAASAFSARCRRTGTIRAEEQLGATVYAQKIALAHHELQAGHVDRARQLLAVCPPKYRHWEWHYLQRLCNPELLSIRAWSPHQFSSVAISPDGDRIAACVGHWLKPGARVNIYDAQSGRLIRELQSHRLWRIDDVNFSRDGQRIASVSGFYDKNHNRAVAGEVKVWDATDGAAPLFEFEGSVHSVAFSSDGRRLAWVTQDNSVIYWDLESAQKLMELPAETVVHSGAVCHDILQSCARVLALSVLPLATPATSGRRPDGTPG